jgi:uncharacterized membrane protein YukC
MKNWEVGIIIVAVVIVGYLWYQKYSSTTTSNPTNATSKGFIPCGIGGV